MAEYKDGRTIMDHLTLPVTSAARQAIAELDAAISPETRHRFGEYLNDFANGRNRQGRLPLSSIDQATVDEAWANFVGYAL